MGVGGMRNATEGEMACDAQFWQHAEQTGTCPPTFENNFAAAASGSCLAASASAPQCLPPRLECTVGICGLQSTACVHSKQCVTAPEVTEARSILPASPLRAAGQPLAQAQHRAGSISRGANKPAGATHCAVPCSQLGRCSGCCQSIMSYKSPAGRQQQKQKWAPAAVWGVEGDVVKM